VLVGLPTGTIPTPDELARIVDGIIRQRLALALEQEQRWIAIQEKKRALEALKRRDFWNRCRRWSGFLNSWTWAVLLVLASFAAGIYVGLNVFPSAVLCPSEYSPCFWFRLDDEKGV
jgi:hypothetical protein